jgi:dTDP-4-dehydrorhamnose reductase
MIHHYSNFQFNFIDIDELDICDTEKTEQYFNKYTPDFCINTAAYTAVDLAESDKQKAFQVNATGAKNLALACLKYDTILIHISTDFVFDGYKSTPYNEDDAPNPISIYGQSKLEGEKNIQALWSKHIIIRTSWLYSPFGNNFLKTMLRLAETKTTLSVVNDQIGTPTNALDLAEAIMKVISKHVLLKQRKETIDFYGIYHFSNEGQCSWFDFAKKIFEINNINIVLRPISTSSYPTLAKRPKYSVLDKSKIKNVFDIKINDWESSLKNNLN